MQSSAPYEIENMYVQSLGIIFNNLKKVYISRSISV